MRKFKFLFILILFTLFVSSVDALTYDVDTKVVNSFNSSLYEIRLSLKDISEVENGIVNCSMNLEFSDNVKLNGELRTINDWSMVKKESYYFSTLTPVLDNNEIVIIPIKVKGEGIVGINDIECFDGTQSLMIDNKTINITYDKDNVSNNDSFKDSNCDLSDIILSDGEINFSSSINQYELEISDLSKLEIIPVLASNSGRYTINRDNNNIVINVVAEDGTNKNYNILVKEIKNDLKRNSDSDFIPTFIIVTFIFVVINMIRVGKKFISN